VRSPALGAAALLALLFGAGPAGADEGPALAPALVHHSLRCHEDGGCRIDCYQGGRSVISRLNLARADEVRLVSNIGFSEALDPLLIEIRPAGGGTPQTLLLAEDVTCDFQALTLEPRAPE